MYNSNIYVSLVTELTKAKKLNKAHRMRFFPGYSSNQIRKWFEKNGMSRHFPIEYLSTEIAICTPKGIVMKKMSENEEQLSVWGGILQDNENFLECASRTLSAETGINFQFSDNQFVEFLNHHHRDKNGDIMDLCIYRFVLYLHNTPQLVFDYNSKGFEYITKTNYHKNIDKVPCHQADFIQYVLDTYYK